MQKKPKHERTQSSSDFRSNVENFMNNDLNMNKRKSLNEINMLQTVKKSGNSVNSTKQTSTLLEKYYESTMKKGTQTSPGSSNLKNSFILQKSDQKRDFNVF